MSATAKIRGSDLTSMSVEKLTAALVADAVAGELAGSVSANTWRAIRTRYAVSSDAVRLAAIELRELGLLSVDGSGLRVADPESWRLFAQVVFRQLHQDRGREVIAGYMDARRFVDAELSARAARRRGAQDVVDLSQALRSFLAAARGTGPAVGLIRSYRAADDQLRSAIGRASRNRYLDDVSTYLRRHLHDAEWIPRRALTCSTAVATVYALADSIRCGDAEGAFRAAQAEVDLLESWVWQRLSGCDHLG